ncbi:hypothetical protein HIM_05775 [Hirsutella minnesotensis 3608]|uniref:V-snare n=1 Tax=Hirsutella minnesotensis 3608 TaxID=1043627 RepID=A0A0F7ZK14_9HYPO|nr:hypothetical protein HIM_05775 [Hirsutella minnesotensis 3608]
MSSKRDYDDMDEGEVSDDEPTPKRPKRLTGAQSRHHHQSSAADPTWGQKYVFSNLGDATTIPYGEESDFEDDADAMAYLQSVRQESYGIPHLLIAPTRGLGPQLPPELERHARGDTAEDGHVKQEPDLHQDAHAVTLDDEHAYYEDGAYIARPSETHHDLGELDAHDDTRQKELHEAYFASILDRYRALRRALHSRPPPGAAKRLSSARPTYLDRNPSTVRKWATVLRTANPHPLQLAIMDKYTVLRVLDVLLGGNFLRGGHTLTERTSQWLWGLLARLPDPGELDSAETASIRDLGRRAVLLGRSLAEMAALRAELEDDALGLHEDGEIGEEVDVSGADADMSEGEVHLKTDVFEDSSHEHMVQDDLVKKESSPTAEIVSNDSVKEETDSVEMDLSSDSGEHHEPEAAHANDDDGQALEGAKKALLSKLENRPDETDDDEAEAARLRLRMNMRATLSMILTVAGEYYGQRDLLEFREPFVGL